MPAAAKTFPAYKCFVEVDVGEAPSDCVINVDHFSSCDFGTTPSGRERKVAHSCPWWKRDNSVPAS